MNLEQAAQTVLTQCMAVKSDDKVLMLYDLNKKNIAEVLAAEAKEITNQVDSIEVPVSKQSGQEPPEEVAEQMKTYDVIIMTTTKSFSHTKARRDALEAGARIASMPGITEEIMQRTLSADYYEIRALTQKLGKLIDPAKTIRMTTALGTDISMSVEGKHSHGLNGGIFDEPGKWGNLPEGEVCLAPVEGTTNGTLVIDATMAGVGKLDNPITLIVKDGFAISIEGGEEAEKLKERLESVNDPNAFAIAEVAIGTNDKAEISGCTLEDEKVKGTAHMALGNNMSFEGTINVPIHLDGVFTKPTIYIDEKKIMENGEFLV